MITDEKARLLIADIADALAHGTKHYALDGRPLLTVEDVLVALEQDEAIELRIPE